MPVEIERKYLVKNESWKKDIVSSEFYRQGYLQLDKKRTVRVRIAGEKAFLTIKGIRTGISRPEYEYEIPVDEAGEMLSILCEKPVIEKVRHKVRSGGMIWEVDVFEKENEGLIIAELETESVHTEFSLPEWAGAEVTEDSRYSNSNLVKNPYSAWEKEKA